jgi:HemY protein
MAELEQLEGDEGRVREWMRRALNAARDPAWTADGFVSDRWLPVSPVTGRLDAFQWKVPVAELGEREPLLIEAAPHEPPRQKLPRRGLPREVASPPLGNVTADNGEQAANLSRPAMARPVPRVAPIVPLTQVPDDPGPEPETEPDIEVATEPRPDGWDRKPWQRIRQLFR